MYLVINLRRRRKRRKYKRKKQGVGFDTPERLRDIQFGIRGLFLTAS